MKKLLFLIIIIVIAGGVYWAFQQRQNTTNITGETASPDTTEENSSWSTYSNSDFSVDYPSDYTFIAQTCLRDCTSDFIEGTSDSSIEVHSEKDGGIGCHLGLCLVTPERTVEYNGVAWEYLGRNSYSDVGQTWSFYAYRTIRDGYRYYVQFSDNKPLNDDVMRSFEF